MAKYESKYNKIVLSDGTEIIEELNVDVGTSDGYHTFDELYYHRMVLFSIICNQNSSKKVWKSKLHSDGTMYEEYFIVGISTEEGDFSYHYHNKYWDLFNVVELNTAPEWDGHTSSDITRLYSLL